MKLFSCWSFVDNTKILHSELAAKLGMLRKKRLCLPKIINRTDDWNRRDGLWFMVMCFRAWYSNGLSLTQIISITPKYAYQIHEHYEGVLTAAEM